MLAKLSNCALGILALLNSANAYPGQQQANKGSSVGSRDVDAETYTETQLRTLYRTHVPSSGPVYITKIVSVAGTQCPVIQQSTTGPVASAAPPASGAAFTTTITHDVTAYIPASMAAIMSILTVDGPASIPSSHSKNTPNVTDSPSAATSPSIGSSTASVAEPSRISEVDLASGAKSDNKLTSSGGNFYTVYYNQDSSGDTFDVYPVKTGGFRTCFDACDNTASCVGFTYWGLDSGNCYLKSTAGSLSHSSNPEIISCFKDPSVSEVSHESTPTPTSPKASESSNSTTGVSTEAPVTISEAPSSNKGGPVVTAACNPAHQYPGNAVCTETNGSLTLVVPSTSSAAILATSVAPPPNQVTVTVTHDQPVVFSMPNAVTVTVTATSETAPTEAPATSTSDDSREATPVWQMTTSTRALPGAFNTSAPNAECAIPDGGSTEFIMQIESLTDSGLFDGLYLGGPAPLHSGYNGPPLTEDAKRAAPCIFGPSPEGFDNLVSIRGDEASCDLYGLEQGGIKESFFNGPCDLIAGYGAGDLRRDGDLIGFGYGGGAPLVVCTGRENPAELWWTTPELTNIFRSHRKECNVVRLKAAHCPEGGRCHHAY